MLLIDQKLTEELTKQARWDPRLRMHCDLRTSPEDGGQRMLNVLLPGTKVPIHRHPNSNENVLCLSGKLVEVLYEEDSCNRAEGLLLKECARILLDPSAGSYGCVVPAGVWHTVEVNEPAVIYEAKDGKYGEDGTETWGL
ncbi:MAG: WbuC family cupin fold metalloprotein [Paraprevotella sp.]|nr:WbuC family cupin fold metalloprotein [Paraprevotella sp.]